MLARGNTSVGDYAGVIEQHPRDRDAIVQRLQKTHGNSFVQQVVAAVAAAGKATPTNDSDGYLARYPKFRDAMTRINAQARADQINEMKHAGVTDWVVDKTESAKETVVSWYAWLRHTKQTQYLDPHVELPPLTMYDDVDRAIAAANAAYDAHDAALLRQRVAEVGKLTMARDQRGIEYYDRKASGAQTALDVTETTALTAGTIAGFAAAGPAGGAAAAGLIKADIEGAEEHGRGEQLDWKKIGFAGLKEAGTTMVFALVAGPLGKNVFQPALGKVLGPALTKALGPAAAASVDRYVAQFLAGVGTQGLMTAVELELDRMHSGVKMTEHEFVSAVVEQMVRGGVQQLFIDAITHGGGYVAGKVHGGGAAASPPAPAAPHEVAAPPAHEAAPAAHEPSKADVERAVGTATVGEKPATGAKPATGEKPVAGEKSAEAAHADAPIAGRVPLTEGAALPGGVRWYDVTKLSNVIDEAEVRDHGGDNGLTVGDLVTRIKKDGFDPKFAVYVDDQGRVPFGNHRLLAVKELGYTQIPGRPMPTDPMELMKAALPDNQTIVPDAPAAAEAAPAPAHESAPAGAHDVTQADLARALQRPTGEQLRDKALRPDITGPLANDAGKAIGAKLGPVPDGKIQLADGSLADATRTGVTPEARAFLDTLSAKQSELAGSPRKVVVDGGGPTGALTALSAFHLGHDVTIVEMRDQATLPVLWSNRPGSMDILKEIDPVLAQRIAAASGTVHFYEHVDVNGHRDASPIPPQREADAAHATGDARGIASAPSSWQSQNKTEVNLMWDRLEELAAQENQQAAAEGRPPRLHLMRGYEVKSLPVDGNKRGIVVQKVEQHLVKTNSDGTKDTRPYTPGELVPEGYKVERSTDGVDVPLGTPDDLFIAEGAGSKTRAMAGSQSVAVGPSADFIAGYFKGAPLKNQDGVQGGARQRDDIGRDGQLLHNVAGTGSQTDGTWALPEVDRTLDFKDPKSIEAYFGRPMSEKEATLAYYKQQVAKVLECSPSDIPDNAFELNPTKFTLQSHVSSPVAADASNVHLVGDARGNSHFLASLGKVTGTGTHQMAIRQYYQALAWGLNPDVAVALLERRLDAGTRVWLKSGLPSITGFKYADPDDGAPVGDAKPEGNP
jgi:2-polyprenyl-6-methoxyphenol hydroxylase-like FAD-dependent oxidoreductase